MFDQNQPETPNDFIIRQIKTRKPVLVGLNFLSTTRLPYARILARRIRPDAQVSWHLGVFASLNAGLVKLQCPRSGFCLSWGWRQLLLDLLKNMDDPSSVGGVTWAEGRACGEQPESFWGTSSRSVGVSRSGKPRNGFCGIDAAGRAGGSFHGTIYDHARPQGCPGPACSAISRSSMRKVARQERRSRGGGSSNILRPTGMGLSIFVDDHFHCFNPSASKRSVKGH